MKAAKLDWLVCLLIKEEASEAECECVEKNGEIH